MLRETTQDLALIHECLEKVLSSNVFEKSSRQQELLRYLLKETIAGNADRLKGYTLGVEIFGRSGDFDPATDAIVRVEVGRLRTKLREYYTTEGQNDTMVFDLPKGGYAVKVNIINTTVTQTPSITTPNTPAWHKKFDDEISLAVLPFANLSANPEHEYLVDGIIDNLIFELSRLSGLLLISRQSSFRYRNTEKSAKEIGTELGVKFLLEGSMQTSAGRVRATFKLVEAETESYVWVERFESKMHEIFALQDEITLNIVKVLQIRLSPKEAELFGHEGTENIAAHDALLRGMACHWKYTPKFIVEARMHFAKAVELDPNYASAHAWLARTLLFLWVMRWDSDPTLHHQALVHAKKAAEINVNLPYVQSILGWAHLWHRHKDESISACRQAVAIDPNNFEAYIFLSMALSCAGFGEEALYYIEKAQRMNPHSSPFYEFTLGLAHYVLENYDKAIVAFKRGCEMNGTFPPNFMYLAATYAQLGMKKEMVEAREAYFSILGGDKSKIIEPPWTNQTHRKHYIETMKIVGVDIRGIE